MFPVEIVACPQSEELSRRSEAREMILNSWR
jgi:hypothetical protein